MSSLNPEAPDRHFETPLDSTRQIRDLDLQVESMVVRGRGP